MPSESDFASLLRQHRRASGLTQEELAARSGLSVGAISSLERGQSRLPHRDTVELLAAALSLSEEASVLFSQAARRARLTAMVSMASIHVADNSQTMSTAPQVSTALDPDEVSPAVVQISGGNLPIPLTPLLGREREEAAIVHLLSQADLRLLTLTGPAGVGKTRLAVQVALELHPRFANGVYFVPLAQVIDPMLVVPTIAYTLGLREGTKQTAAEALISYLQDKEALLVLDNMEQVLSSAPALASLLTQCLKVKALVTSRASLHVRGEHELAVPPLALPDQAQLPPLDELTRYPAIALFLQRARAVKPNFTLSQSNVQAVAGICARLDGLPLAIELAAARTKLLPPETLLVRLEGSMRVLPVGPQDLPERQRTLESAVAWSYDLLDPHEQQLLRRLAVFMGGWTLEAAESICTGDSEVETASEVSPPVLDLLASLMDKSLVVEEIRDGDTRYRLLETTREFARERLEATGDADIIRGRHAEYYLSLAKRIDLIRLQQASWMHLLTADYDNLHAALTWAQERDEVAFGLQLCWELWLFWYMLGYLSQGSQWLQIFLDRIGDGRTPTQPQPKLAKEGDREVLRARALHAAGTLMYGMGELTRAQGLLEEALALRRNQGDAAGTCATLNNLGLIAETQGDYEGALRLHAENLAIDRSLNNGAGAAIALVNLGNCEAQLGRYDEAVAAYEESLLLFREAGDIDGAALALNNSGEIAVSRGKYEEAQTLLGAGISLVKSIESPLTLALLLCNLAAVACHNEEYDVARNRLHESLELRRRAGDQVGIAFCLEGMAEYSAGLGELERAAKLYGTAAKLREALGTPVPPLHRAQFDQQLARVREGLSAAQFAGANLSGRQERLETVLAGLDYLKADKP